MTKHKFKFLKLDFHEHKIRVLLNRPPVNALSITMIEELRQCAEWISGESNIWLVSLSSSGKIFCAGADLKERVTIPEDKIDEVVHGIRTMTKAWANLPQVVLMGINGMAFGGGLELALAGDLIAINENALIGLPETSLGIIPGAGGTQRLSRRTTLATAKKWIFTASKFEANEALKDGVVDFVFPGATFENDFDGLIDRVFNNAPQALKAAKFALNRGFDTDIKTGLDIEREAYKSLIQTEDRVEALRAFKEKRKANWSGR
jgi:methylglutaconyl-CoA hydratase